jgi:hypothetical protein
VAAAFASTGKLRTLASEDAVSFARLLRKDKRLDPTLGIYAAYAYALADDDAGTESVYSYFNSYQRYNYVSAPLPIPFDVALLGGALGKSRRFPSSLKAPFCPMMSLGWSMLDAYGYNAGLPKEIINAGARRLNAEWTTLPLEHSQALIQLLKQGAI